MYKKSPNIILGFQVRLFNIYFKKVHNKKIKKQRKDYLL